MSKILNTEGMKPGSIYRIALENFVTYKQVELYPGPSLNMIIGPNGTGKSTFVCAIVLGLCGKTSVIGRAKKISEYVRSGCQEAVIEIELYREEGQRNVIITRKFNLDGASTWCVDHKTVREKQVQELINSMNIQVDNLCQLLPQDRVQDFSKMNPQELLRSTLAAVGGHDSVEQLDELIETRNKQRNLSTKMTNNAQLLQEQVRLNERLKVEIDAMQQRKEIENKINLCEKKKLWIEYQGLREKVIEYSNDRKEAAKLVELRRSRVEPLEKSMQEAKNGISKLEQQKLTASREINTTKDKVKETLETIKTQNYKLRELESSYQEKLERHRNREREIDEAKMRLEKLVDDRKALVEKVGDEAKVKMELAELHKSIAKTNKAIETLKKSKLDIQYDLENNITPQIRLYQNKIRTLKDVGEKRLEVLRNYSEDCYQAVMWFRQNKHMFTSPVYEPMLLQINFTEPKFARYLETTVANRDLVAFTFESSRDMNLFLRVVRTELNFKRVNAICSAPTQANFQPPTDIKQLSYLGFHTYLVDTISAPDAIIRYLCKQYSIHKIPIGNDHTYKNSGKVPANITYFYTENHRFVVRTSSYSGAKSSSTVEVRPARMLANTVDVEQLEKLGLQLSRFEESAQTYKTKVDEFDRKIGMLETHLNGWNTSRKLINEGVDKVRTISAQVRMQQRKVQDLQNEPALDIEAERGRCRKKQKECVLKQCVLHRELRDLVKGLHTKIFYADVWKATLENIENLLIRAKSTAKEKLLEAKRSCNNKLPQDADFPFREDFEKLPANLTALQEYCYELQTRIDCMDKGDEQIVKEYEEREKQIKKLQSEVSNSTTVNTELQDKLNRIKAIWLPPLEELLSNINRDFGVMFEKLDCAGEVKLDRGKAEEEYDQYGVMILVKFRATDTLQQLSRHAQSGGERALSTALYLMALQRIATVPFRCVDEINQGMDPVNERKMFQLLVKVTTEGENSQYFLLTPKLLENLEYNEKIMVHTIMNGKNIMNYKHWKIEKFIERARALRANNID